MHSFCTPGNLQSMRLLLGISRDDMGRLLGIPPDEVRNLERSRTLFTYQGHAERLSTMLYQVNELLEDQLEKSPPPYLFTFPNEEVLKMYEPELHEFFIFNTAHQMFVARLYDAWTTKDHFPNTLDLVPTHYEEFLSGRKLKDALESRYAWADAHVKTIKMIDGMPPETRSAKPKKDGIQYVRMKAGELSQGLADLRLSPKEFSLICGASEKRVTLWLQDREEIPHHVATLIAAMTGGKEAALAVTTSSIVNIQG